MAIELCDKCDREFEDDQHFVICNIEDCPMKGESVLDMLLEDEEEDETN